MQYLFLGIIFFVALFLEASITTLPIVLLLLLLVYVFYRQEWVFILAFLLGIFSDMVSVRTVGSTSLFFLVFLFFIFLYQRKFEIGSSYFVFFSLLVGTICYTLVFGIGYGVFIACIIAFFGVCFFWGMQKIIEKGKKNYF